MNFLSNQVMFISENTWAVLVQARRWNYVPTIHKALSLLLIPVTVKLLYCEPFLLVVVLTRRTGNRLYDTSNTHTDDLYENS